MATGNSSFLQPLEQRRLLSSALHVDGIGVIGDSYSDEYQFYPPDRSTAKNWVEQLQEDSGIDFGALFSTDPEGPRNEGFEFNWAVSGATSTDMIVNGQVAGAAAQAAAGDVDLVVSFIGGNDFRGVFFVLATQGVPAALDALSAAVPTVATNIATAVGTILSPSVLGANPDVQMILTTVPKLSYLPEVKAALIANPALEPFVAGVDQATGILNQQILNIASSSDRIAVADFAGLVDRIFSQKKLKVGHVLVNRTAIENPTNHPACFVLADRLHPGTIGQALLANLYVETANNAFGTQLHKLSDQQILENAGLARSYAGQSWAVRKLKPIESSTQQTLLGSVRGVRGLLG